MNIKTSYGLAKYHKPNFEAEKNMRPIVSAINCITENFNKNFMSKLLNNIKTTYSLKSSKEFSIWFKETNLHTTLVYNLGKKGEFPLSNTNTTKKLKQDQWV